jgi:hypothetical protein
MAGVNAPRATQRAGVAPFFRRIRRDQRPCRFRTLLRTSEQRPFCVLRRYGHNRLRYLRIRPAASDYSNVTKVAARIGCHRLNFRCVVGGDQFESVQLELPPIWQRVGQRHVHDARSFPVPPPPGCRVQAPKVPGPAVPKVCGSRAFYARPDVRHAIFSLSA